MSLGSCSFDVVSRRRYKADMKEWRNVAIGILRPPNAAHTRLMRDEIEDGVSRSSAELNEHTSSRIDELRSMFEEATRQLGVKFALTEYQLHEDKQGVAIVTGRRARRAVENDILVSFDPTPTQYNFVTRPRQHPLQRSVVAFSDRETMINLASLLGAQRVPLIQDGQEVCLQRVFALHLPLNDDSAAGNYQHNLGIVRDAVRYPDIQTQTYTYPPDRLKLLDAADPLSQRENIHHLSEPSKGV